MSETGSETAETRPQGRRATMNDVANRARVSVATVSNAINGTRHVEPETRRRIDAAIAELGYAPNLSARRVRTGRASAIAVFSSMPVAVAAGASRLGFMMEIAASAAIAALEHNVALVLVPPMPDAAAALANVEIDGAIVLEPSDDDPFLALLARRGTPVISVGASRDPGIPHVALDYEAIATLLLDHLLEAGATRPILLTGASARASHRMTETCYRARAARLGFPPRVLQVPEHAGEEGARAVMQAALASGDFCDGVLVPVDAFATGAMQALREAGLRVPEDVRVVTRYDGLRAREERPALTALDLRLDEVARLAIDALMARLSGLPTAGAIAAPSPRLVVRASTVDRLQPSRSETGSN